MTALLTSLGPADFKKFLQKHVIPARKPSIFKGVGRFYVPSVIEAESAIGKLNGLEMKGNKLRVALDRDDGPPSKKLRIADPGEGTSEDPVQLEYGENDSVESAMLDVVVPFHGVAYEEQLRLKQEVSKRLLTDIGKQICHAVNLPVRAFVQKIEEGLAPMKPAPSAVDYRNKCEFSVGYGENGKPCVGFRMARFRDGNATVVSPDACTHIPANMKATVAAFQSFLNQSKYAALDVKTNDGYWSQLTVRRFHLDLMVIVVLNPQDLNDSSIQEIKSELKDCFMPPDNDPASLGFRVTSLYLVRQKRPSDPLNFELISGTPYVYEILSGKRYRVSPAAFFQTNTAACEVLYETVAEIAQLTPEMGVLDICCGIGTIGLSLVDKVKWVAGIESIAEAIEDAEVNAKAAGVSDKCLFVAGKVEDSFEGFLKQVKHRFRQSSTENPLESVVAVVDPPRAGVPPKVIAAIRDVASIKRVVYLSCDPGCASKNFVDLCRMPSNKYHGLPFKLKKVVPVDMFPQTKHFEWVMLFERS